MKLNELSPAEGSTKSRKRIGRGVASGWGKTAGKGSKGLKARSGGSVRPGFEGGQMPIHRRLPKRGFTNIFKLVYAIVNIGDLSIFENNTIVDETSLIISGLVKGKYDGIKILGNGDLNKSLIIKECILSKTAQDKIKNAGGKIEA
jgi:large subunit ribosomal protein L15